MPPQRVYTTVDRSSVREVCARARAQEREEQLFRGMQTNVWFFFSLFQTSFCSCIYIVVTKGIVQGVSLVLREVDWAEVMRLHSPVINIFSYVCATV